MIQNDKGRIKVVGNSLDVIEETIEMVYSIRSVLSKKNHPEHIMLLDYALKKVLAGDIDDCVANFQQFNNTAEMEEWLKEKNEQQSRKDAFGDIFGDLFSESEGSKA